MIYYLFKHIEQTKSHICGMAMLNPGWIHMTRNFENESVIIFGKKNSTLLQVDNEVVEVKPGRVVILPAGHLHKGVEQIKEAVSYYWIHIYNSIETQDEKRYFLPKVLDEKEAQTILSSPAVAYQRFQNEIILPFYIDVSNPQKIEIEFNQILQEYKKPGFSPLIYRFLLEKLLLDIAAECFIENKKSNLSQSASLVNQVLLVLEDELSNPNASVKYFANKLNVNPDYLGRCFKDAMQISVGQYIAQQRLVLACSRLRESFSSIDEICVQCGYGSRRQFYDEFKKLTGKTPAAYRKESAFISTNLE